MVPDPENPGEYKPIKEDLTRKPIGSYLGSPLDIPIGGRPPTYYKPPLGGKSTPSFPVRPPFDRPILTLPKEYWTVQPGTGMKPGAMGGSGGNMVLVKNPEYKPPLPTPPINFKPYDKPQLETTTPNKLFRNFDVPPGQSATHILPGQAHNETPPGFVTRAAQSTLLPTVIGKYGGKKKGDKSKHKKNPNKLTKFHGI